MLKTLTTFAFALLLAAGASAQSVFVVAPAPGPGVFSTDIQPAVNAAANGDLVLVKAGAYSGFTINAKGVSVVADAGAAVVANGVVLVINVSASQRVLLQGLTVHGDPSAPAIVTQDSMGPVWIESCTVTGGTRTGPGLVAISSNSCPSVVIQRCSLTGGNATTGGPVNMGGPALHVANSGVAVADSQCTGGNGAPTSTGSGGFGGPGLRVLTGSVFASGTAFQGGAGAAPVPPSFPGGLGGAGINTEGAVTTLQCTFAGGPGFPNGAPTVVGGAGSLTIIPDVARHFSITSPVREGQALTITAGGVPGEIAWFLFAPSPGPIKLLLPFEGSLVLPAGSSAFAIGMIPGGGSLTTPPIVVPNLPAALQGTIVWCQSLLFGSPHAVIGPASALVLLDAAL